MLTTANQKPISVGILEISSQNKAILEFFFANAGRKMFKDVSLDVASAFIIDYDSVGAKNSWESTYKETKKPGIIISIKEVNLPNCIWLPKPLTVQALTEAGASIKEMIFQGKKETKQLFTAQAPAKSVSSKNTQEADEIIADKAIPILEEVLEEAIVEKKIPELATAEIETTTLAESSTSFAVSPNLVDIDLAPQTAKNTNKIATKKAKTPTKAVNTDKKKVEESEIDILLASLISGGDNNKVDSLLSNFPDDEEVENKPKEAAITLETPKETELELKTITKEKVVNKVDTTELKTNEIDIIDFELETAPPEKLELTTSDITDDGLAMSLQDHTDDSKISVDIIDNGTLFSPAKADNKVESNISTKSNDELDKLVSEILPATKKQTKKTSEDELQSLLEEIRHEANESNKKEESSEQPTTVTEERWMLTCGDNDDIEEIKDLCVLTPSNHMIATLLETIEKANGSKKVLRLKYKKVIIVIEPATDRIYCEPSIYSKEYADICYETASKDDIKIHELDTSEMRLYRKKMRTDKERTHTFEAFIWTTSLLTSRGRLPVNTDFSSNIGLKYWPNLTRVEKIPHMMQIAAILHKKSTSLQKASLELGISQKYIFAFYNAALSLDIIKNTSNNDSSTAIDEETIKNKGFFSRLLKRLSS